MKWSLGDLTTVTTVVSCYICSQVFKVIIQEFPETKQLVCTSAWVCQPRQILGFFKYLASTNAVEFKLINEQAHLPDAFVVFAVWDHTAINHQSSQATARTIYPGFCWQYISALKGRYKIPSANAPLPVYYKYSLDKAWTNSVGIEFSKNTKSVNIHLFSSGNHCLLKITQRSHQWQQRCLTSLRACIIQLQINIKLRIKEEFNLLQTAHYTAYDTETKTLKTSP